MYRIGSHYVHWEISQEGERHLINYRVGNQNRSFESRTVIYSLLFYRFLFQNFGKNYVTEIKNTSFLTAKYARYIKSVMVFSDRIRYYL